MQSKHTRAQFQGTFAELCAIKSGRQVPIDKFNERQARENKLLEQSRIIADKLESQGIQAYQENDLTLVGLHSGMSKPIEDFRNVIFIPSVAKVRRAPQLRFLEYCLQDHPQGRAFTITSGPRVVIPKRKTDMLGALSEMACEINESEHLAGIERARETIKKMHRTISRINAEDFMKSTGASFEYRATEFGEIVETDDGLSIHPHVHAVLIMTKGAIQKHRWSELLSKIHAYLGAYCHDCGIIRQPREFVKYCAKPDDVIELSPSALADLFAVSRNLRMHESLGSFRTIKRELKENELKLVRLNGKVVSMEKPSEGKLSEEDKPWQPPSGFRSADPEVVAFIEPAPVFAPVTEPLLLVHGLAGRDVSEVLSLKEVEDLRHAISVHTKSLTVLREKEKNREFGKIFNESKQKIPQESSSVVAVL